MASTWFFISAISGLTTIAVPSIIKAGKLVAEALPTAGGHDHEGVAAVQYALDDGFLVTFELTESEELFESLPGGYGNFGHYDVRSEQIAF